MSEGEGIDTEKQDELARAIMRVFFNRMDDEPDMDKRKADVEEVLRLTAPSSTGAGED